MSRVLYVEDDCLLQMDGEASLIEGGYEVVVAANGEMACDYLRRDEASYDALVTDIDLPGEVQGWRIATLSREINGRLPVIYVTGEASGDFKTMGVARSLLMPKPFAWGRLMTSLSCLIEAELGDPSDRPARAA